MALATVYVAWGSTYLAIRYMDRTIPPVTGTAIRLFAAGFVLLAWNVARSGVSALRIGAREALGAIAVGILMLGAARALIAIGEERVGSGTAALLVATVPLWVGLFDAVRDRRVRGVETVGLAAGFAGVVVVIWTSGGLGGHGPVADLALIVGAALAEATGVFLASRLPSPSDPVVGALVGMIASGLGLAILALSTGELGHLRIGYWSTQSVLALVYLAVPGAALPFAVFTWLSKRVPAATSASYAYVNPVVALLLGWLVASEHIGIGTATGGALIVGAVVSVVLSGINETRRSDEPTPGSTRAAGTS